MHLYLVRHGESEGNLPSFKNPRVIDVPLTDRGHAQAQALGAWISEGHLLPVDHLYCSTLRRTRETVSHIQSAIGLEPIFNDLIREIGNNSHDHAPIDGGDFSYNDYWASEKPFSSITDSVNGESLIHFRARIGIFLSDIIEKHPKQVVMAVCHGFVIDAFMDIAYNIGPFRSMEVWTSNTGIVHLEFKERKGRERWRLHYHNRVEHLKEVGGLGLTLGGRDHQ